MVWKSKAQYLQDLPEKLIESCRLGKSVVQFCAENGIPRPTFYAWKNSGNFPELEEAWQLGHDICESHYEDKLQKAMFEPAPAINTTLAVFYMKNRFSWVDKMDIDAKSKVTQVSHEEALEKLKK